MQPVPFRVVYDSREMQQRPPLKLNESGRQVPNLGTGTVLLMSANHPAVQLLFPCHTECSRLSPCHDQCYGARRHNVYIQCCQQGRVGIKNNRPTMSSRHCRLARVGLQLSALKLRGCDGSSDVFSYAAIVKTVLTYPPLSQF